MYKCKIILYFCIVKRFYKPFSIEHLTMTQFQKFYQGLKKPQQKAFRDRAKQECGIKDGSSFRLWNAGLAVSERYHQQFNQIAQELFNKTIFK